MINIVHIQHNLTKLSFGLALMAQLGFHIASFGVGKPINAASAVLSVVGVVVLEQTVLLLPGRNDRVDFDCEFRLLVIVVGFLCCWGGGVLLVVCHGQGCVYYDHVAQTGSCAISFFFRDFCDFTGPTYFQESISAY